MSIHLKGKSFVQKLIFHWCPFIATVTTATICSVQAVYTQYIHEMRKGSEILKCFTAQTILFKVDLVSFAQARFSFVGNAVAPVVIIVVVSCLSLLVPARFIPHLMMLKRLKLCVISFFFIHRDSHYLCKSYRHSAFNVESYTRLKLYHNIQMKIKQNVK